MTMTCLTINNLRGHSTESGWWPGAHLLRIVAFLCWIGLFLPAPAQAQTNQSITGIVHDSLTGLPIEGVQIALDIGGFMASSDGSGRFALLSVPIGRWELRATRIGYRELSPIMIEVTEGFARLLQITLAQTPVTLPGHVVESDHTSLTAPTAVRRYTRDEIVKNGHRTIAEALDAIPGVMIYGSPETPGGTRVSVAGANAMRVAVLWDGLPLAAGADGSVDLDAIPLATVSAIEVIPSSQSAGYGDAAMGGAVNLLTQKSLSGKDHHLEFNAGGHGTVRGAVGSHVPVGGHAGQWSAEWSGRGDTFTYPDADSVATRNGVGTDSWRGYAGLLPGESTGIKTSAFWYRAKVGVPGAVKQLTPRATNRNNRLRLQASWETPLSRNLRTDMAGWYEVSEDHHTSPGRIPSDDELGERFLGTRAAAAWNTPKSRVRFEFEGRYRRIKGVNNQRPQFSFGTRHRREFTLRGTIDRTLMVGRHAILLSLVGAIDSDDRNSPFYTPRADLAWSFPVGLRARIGAGRSFRRPLLTSLFWKADAFAVGNPDLRPERASEWDAGIAWTKTWLTLDTRYFERRVRDIIFWQRSTVSGQYKPGNVDRSFIFGREDQVQVRVRNDLFALGYVHVFHAALDRSGEPNYDGEALVLSPRHTHDLSVKSQVNRLTGRITARWVSLRYIRRDNEPDKSLAPYHVVDGFIRLQLRRLSPQIGIAVRIDNLTNQHIELIERYPSPGRTWSISTDWEF